MSIIFYAAAFSRFTSEKKKYNLYNSTYNKSSDIDYDYLSYIGTCTLCDAFSKDTYNYTSNRNDIFNTVKCAYFIQITYIIIYVYTRRHAHVKHIRVITINKHMIYIHDD